MMRIRIINIEGKDEVYKGVIKLTFAGDFLHIYCDGVQYKELTSNISFFQIWEQVND